MFTLLRRKKAYTATGSFGDFVGFFAAHAVWQTEEGDAVLPVVAREIDGERSLERVVGDDYRTAAEQALGQFAEGRLINSYSVCALDGYLTLPSGEKVEALTIEALDNSGKRPSSVTIAIPYRSARSPQGLAVYEPQVMASTQIDVKGFMREFAKGVASHTAAAEFWERHKEKARQ